MRFRYPLGVRMARGKSDSRSIEICSLTRLGIGIVAVEDPFSPYLLVICKSLGMRSVYTHPLFVANQMKRRIWMDNWYMETRKHEKSKRTAGSM